jgi:hypothetical protein
MEPKTYKLTPLSVSLGMIPSFATTKKPGEFVTTGACVPVMNVGEIESGSKETEIILKDYKQRYRMGDRKALWELIDRNPAFMLDDWVAQKAYVMLKIGFPSRGRGRRFGTATFHPLVILGLVDWMIKIGEAKNKENAFRKLSEQRFCSYDTAKKTYYDAQRNKYIQHLVFEKLREQREISQPEFENFRNSADMMENNTTLKLQIKPG